MTVGGPPAGAVDVVRARALAGIMRPYRVVADPKVGHRYSLAAWWAAVADDRIVVLYRYQQMWHVEVRDGRGRLVDHPDLPVAVVDEEDARRIARDVWTELRDSVYEQPGRWWRPAPTRKRVRA